MKLRKMWLHINGVNRMFICDPDKDIPEEPRCPGGCGLCPDHRQGTCCVLLEVTRRCNLNCPYCFADGGRGGGARWC